MFENLPELTMPHGHCYLWYEPLLWLHVLGDGITALAYTIIPLTLIYIVHKRKDIEYDWMFMLFGAFIVLCGITHIAAIVAVWQPIYWTQGILKGLMAIVSIATAWLLIKIVPLILKIPAPATLKKEIDEHKRSKQILELQKSELEHQHEELKRVNEELDNCNMIVSNYVEQAGFEIKVPINTVLSDVERALQYIRSDHLDDAKDILGGIRKSTLKLDKELDSLLVYAMSRSNINLNIQNIGLSDLVKHVMNSKSEMIKQSNTNIQITGSSPIVSVDRMAMILVFDNIISGIINAHQNDKIQNGDKKIEIYCDPIGYSKYHHGAAWKLGIKDVSKKTGLYDDNVTNIKYKLIKSICSTHELEFDTRTGDGGVEFSFTFPAYLNE